MSDGVGGAIAVALFLIACAQCSTVGMQLGRGASSPVECRCRCD